MRGVTFVARSLFALVVVGLISNCSDAPTSPDRTDPAAPPIAFATASNGDGLSITTDKDDYAPGDTVWFTGTGWTAGDSVDIVLTDDPTLDSHHWTVGISGDGTFRDSTYVVDTQDLGVTFTLTATSRANPAQTLTVTFTDAAPTVNSFTLDGTTFTFPPAPPANQPATNPITVAPNAIVTIVVNGTTVANNGGLPRATWKSSQVDFKGGSVNFGDIPVCNDDNVVDPSSVQTVSKTFTFAAPPTANTYDVRVRAFQEDACAGTSGQLTLPGVLIVSAPPVDASAPVVTNVVATPNPANGTALVVLTADVSDATTGNSTIKSAEYRIDAGAWGAMGASDGAFDEVTEGVTVTIAAGTIHDLTDGEHDLCVRGTDALDNTSNGTACTKLLVDKTAPVVSNVVATPNPIKSGSVTVTANAVDALTNVTSAAYTIDGGSDHAMTAQDGTFDSKSEAVTGSISAVTIAGLTEGSHSVCVKAADAVANTSDGTACVSLIVDRTPPVVTNVVLTPHQIKSGSVTVTADAVDALSNVASAAFTIDGGSDHAMTAQDGTFDSKTEAVTGTISSGTIAGLTEGSHSVCV
jgi:hypothetical protein